ncbi:MAG TPA: hypothetical protein VGN42_05475 [Pirellulales bacterium]|nr:hypothetical protein [Pirellulales bacterium]
MSTLTWHNPTIWLAPQRACRNDRWPVAEVRNDLGWLGLCEDSRPAGNDLCRFGLLCEDDRRDAALIDPFLPYEGDRQSSRRMFVDDFGDSSSDSIW